MKRESLLNSARRRLDKMFGGAFHGQQKHDHYRDFGWPEMLTFEQTYRMYRRNSIAAAVVDKTISKTWQDNPSLWETEKPKESTLEKDVANRFDQIRAWQKMAEADRRSMVGRYAGVILRLGDGKRFNEPVDRVGGGLAGLVDIIPFWESQMYPTEYHSDPLDEKYGEPKLYEFNESGLGGDIHAVRQFAVHPDRVIIWSEDGTINGRSGLEPIFNDLIDAEKIKGAGGEGFWKTSRGAPVLEAPAGVTPDDLKQMMGATTNADIIDKMNEQIDQYSQGYDSALFMMGMTAKPMQINLPSPEHFFAAPINSIAAAKQIPVKVLMGSQSGERASTEDASEWDQTCNSRRVNRCKPLIMALVQRMVMFGIIPAREWFIGWQDLTEATSSERLDRAVKMADINAKTPSSEFPPFQADEIREAAGYEPGDWSGMDPTEDSIEL